MKRTILAFTLLGVPVAAIAQSKTDRFNNGMQPILIYAGQLQIGVSCGFFTPDNETFGDFRLSEKMIDLADQIWGLNEDNPIGGVAKRATDSGAQQIEAIQAMASVPTEDQCRAFKNVGDIEAINQLLGIKS